MRTIRSFVRREGRITPAQTRSYETLFPEYSISVPGCPSQAGPLSKNSVPAASIDPAKVFGRLAPCVIEIGFGRGDSLIALAEALPTMDWIGIEVHRPGIGFLLKAVDSLKLKNVRIIEGDAAEVLERFPEASLEGAMIFFPDPWPKARHHKRRLITEAFLGKLHTMIKPGGCLWIKTDWEGYAKAIDQICDDCSSLFQRVSSDQRVLLFPWTQALSQTTTKYERRGIGLGHRVWETVLSPRIGLGHSPATQHLGAVSHGI